MPEKKPTTNYGGNSHKQKLDEEAETTRKPKVEQITSGDAVQRKKPLSRKFADAFAGDDARSVLSYVVMEVMIPAAKTTISDAVSQGIERMLFGDGAPSRGTTRSGYTSYNSMSRRGTRPEPRTPSISARGRAAHKFDEIIIATRGEAEEVLDVLTQMVDQYDTATVSDLYDLVGITGQFTDEKWGWTDLRGARVRRVGEGYLVELPRPVPLD